MYYSSVIRTCFIFIQCTRIWRNCIYISCDSIGTIIFKVYQRVSVCYFGSDDVFFSLFLIHSNLVYTFLWKYSLNLSKRHFPHISVISEGNIARASVYRDCMHEWFVEFILSKMKMYIKQLLLCFSIAIIIKLYMYVLNLYFTLNV